MGQPYWTKGAYLRGAQDEVAAAINDHPLAHAVEAPLHTRVRGEMRYVKERQKGASQLFRARPLMGSKRGSTAAGMDSGVMPKHTAARNGSRRAQGGPAFAHDSDTKKNKSGLPWAPRGLGPSRCTGQNSSNIE